MTAQVKHFPRLGAGYGVRRVKLDDPANREIPRKADIISLVAHRLLRAPLPEPSAAAPARNASAAERAKLRGVRRHATLASAGLGLRSRQAGSFGNPSS